MKEYKCSFCENAGKFKSRDAAVDKGWVFLEFYAPNRIYYKCCPNHKKEDVWKEIRNSLAPGVLEL